MRAFINSVDLVNWDFVTNINSVNDAYSLFLDKLTNIYDRCFPVRRLNKKSISNSIPRKPWITSAILTSIRRKNKLYLRFKSSPTDYNKLLLVNYRNKLTNLIRASKKSYYSNLLDNHKNNLKQTWKILNGLLGRDRKKSYPDCFDIEGTVTSDSTVIANGFNKFFINIGPQLSSRIPSINVAPAHFLNNIPSPPNSLYFTPTDHEEVLKLCTTLKAGTSPGCDGIKPDAIKAVKHHIARPLVQIFNLSMSTGIVPCQFKLAKVVPIFKSGNPSLCNNYRPISLLPVFSKIFERIIHKRLYNFINQLDLLHPSQFGFRHKFSSYMAVLEAYNTIASNLDIGNHTAGIFLDLSKAFDTISHDILLTKLHHYGVRGGALEWFRNYLTDRKQYVTVNDCNSDTGTVQCGVPQGSVLGPLLFILFINDVTYASNKFSFFIYADDTNIVMSNRNLVQLITSLNTELSKISLWFKVNKLSLNIDKSSYVIFKNRHSNRLYNNIHISIDGNELSKVSYTKFLGVYLDECLTWQKHNSYVINIVSKYSGILFRLKRILPTTTLFSLYNTLVLPHLYYCNIIWSDPNNCCLNSILVKQKRIVRLCTNSTWLAHSKPLFSQLNTLTIHDIHSLIKCLFMFMFKTNCLPSNFDHYFVKNAAFHDYDTRSTDLFRPAFFRSDLAKNTIRFQGPLLWNSIPDHVKLGSYMQYLQTCI